MSNTTENAAHYLTVSVLCILLHFILIIQNAVVFFLCILTVKSIRNINEVGCFPIVMCILYDAFYSQNS